MDDEIDELEFNRLMAEAEAAPPSVVIFETVVYPDPPTLCGEVPCVHCHHRHVHETGGRCLSGALPGETGAVACRCPYPHGLGRA